jgi:hypothetical protein
LKDLEDKGKPVGEVTGGEGEPCRKQGWVAGRQEYGQGYPKGGALGALGYATEDTYHCFGEPQVDGERGSKGRGEGYQ